MKRYRNSVPPWDVTREAFESDNAVVPTTAVAVFSGAGLAGPCKEPLCLIRRYYPCNSGPSVLSGGAGVHALRVPGSMLNNPEGSVVDVSSGNWDSMDTFLPQEVFLVDTTNSLHPFFVHCLDVGPLRLTSIAHAFNYRVAVLRDGVKSVARVGRSRRAAGRILQYIGLPWGHQVAVMFQIVCVLAL